MNDSTFEMKAPSCEMTVDEATPLSAERDGQATSAALPSAIRLSHATMWNIPRTGSAPFNHSLGIPIAAGVLDRFFGLLLSSTNAGAAMSLSSVSVIMNVLRWKV